MLHHFSRLGCLALIILASSARAVLIYNNGTTALLGDSQYKILSEGPNWIDGPSINVAPNGQQYLLENVDAVRICYGNGYSSGCWCILNGSGGKAVEMSSGNVFQGDGGPCNTEPPPTTNYAKVKFCNDSSYTRTFNAYYGGQYLSSMTLGPGQCWEISVASTTQANITVVPQTPLFGGPNEDYGFSNLTFNFTNANPPVSQTQNGGYTGTATAPGSNIVWNTPEEGLAKDSTLRDVGNILTKKIGESGQALLSALQALGTNGTSVSVSVTNNNFNTNAVSVSVTNTNDFGALTNFMTNWFRTNLAGLGHTNANDITNAAAAASAGFGETLGTLTNGLAVPTAPSGGGGGWIVSFRGHQFNVDPLSSEMFSGVASAVKKLVGFLSTFLFLLASWHAVSAHVMAITSANQSRSAGQSVLGTNAATPSALLMATVATVAIGFLLVGLVAPLAATYLAPWAANSSGWDTGAAMSGAWYLLNGFVPTQLILAQAGFYLLFRISITGIYLVAATVIRYAVGIAVFYAVVNPASAFNLLVTNQMTEGVLIINASGGNIEVAPQSVGSTTDDDGAFSFQFSQGTFFHAYDWGGNTPTAESTYWLTVDEAGAGSTGYYLGDPPPPPPEETDYDTPFWQGFLLMLGFCGVSWLIRVVRGIGGVHNEA